MKWRDLYEGRHNIITGPEYTWRHALEEKSDAAAIKLLTRRMQRTRWNPIPEIVVSLLVSFAFRKDIELDDPTKALLGKEVDNIDGHGSSLNKFAQSVLEQMFIYGKVGVLADAFGFDAKNEAEAQQLGLRPTLEIVNALSLVDWDREAREPRRLDMYNFARYEFEIVMPRVSASEQPQIRRYSHVLSLIDKKYVISKHYVVVDSNGKIDPKFIDKETKQTTWQDDGQIVTALEEIPLATAEDESWVKDVCEESLRYHNIRSNRDNIQYNQGYQRLFAKGVNFNDPQQLKNFAEYVVSGLPADGDVMWVDPVSTTDYDSAMNNSLDTALKIGLNLLRTLPTDSRAAQAADTIAAEKDSPMALIQAVLTHIETLLRKSINNYAAFKSKKDFDCQLVIPKDFTPEDWQEFLNTVQALGDELKQYPTVKRQIVEKAVKRLRLGKEGEKEALDEIEKIGDTTAQSGQADATRTANDPVTQALNG